jgi:hypothetical protein
MPGPIAGRFWILPSTLAEWVKQEVERLNWSSQCVERARPVMQPRSMAMLHLLAICYLMRIQDSQAIAKTWIVDPILQGLCGSGPPTCSELEQVRSRHSLELGIVLRNVAQRAGPDWFLPPITPQSSNPPRAPFHRGKSKKGGEAAVL